MRTERSSPYTDKIALRAIEIIEMTPEKEQKIARHVEALAALLYEETQPEQVESLAKIEATVREKTLQYITPQLGVFLSEKLQELHREEREN